MARLHLLRKNPDEICLSAVWVFVEELLFACGSRSCALPYCRIVLCNGFRGPCCPHNRDRNEHDGEQAVRW